MVRRLVILAIASFTLGIGLLAGPVFAGAPPQQEPEVFDSPSNTSIPTTTTTTVATTTTAVSPTTIERETTTTEAAVVTTEATTTSIKGVVVARPLPRTGGDFGLQVIVGAGLTAAGLAFAVTARLRRQQAHAGS